MLKLLVVPSSVFYFDLLTVSKQVIPLAKLMKESLKAKFEL